MGAVEAGGVRALSGRTGDEAVEADAVEEERDAGIIA